MISFLTHVLDSFSTSIVSAIAYGYEVLSDDDPYLQLARGSGYALSHCGPPGGTPVDLFPICTSRSVLAVMCAHDSFYSAVPTILVPRYFFLHGKHENTTIPFNKCKIIRLMKSEDRW